MTQKLEHIGRIWQQFF